MEFKGTKGRYHMPCGTTEGSSQCLPNNVVFVGKLPIAKVYGNNIEEATANTVLFKHAPEMLEMLKILIQDIEEEGNYSRQTGYDIEEAKKLIKSATEI